MHADPVLVLGVYRADHPNTATEIVAEMSRGRQWRVDQRWVALGRGSASGPLSTVTVARVEKPTPKFSLLNQVLRDIALEHYAYLLVCDDDISLPAGFLDTYLEIAGRHDFALSQPARSHDSYIDHPFVECLDGLTARRTRFIEIGPLVCVRRDATAALLPFDEGSPMGWGYDFVWPYQMASAGLRMGIIDATPITHSLRPPVAHYNRRTVEQQMRAYLDGRPHLSPDDAFIILDSYV